MTIGAGSMVNGSGPSGAAATTQAKANLVPLQFHCNRVCPDQEATCDQGTGWRGGHEPSTTEPAWDPIAGDWNVVASTGSTSKIGWITCSDCYDVDPGEI